ncbi:MAG: LysM peptidoglycan-binding domain-containing protein [Ignavibacteriaceae bacterium]
MKLNRFLSVLLALFIALPVYTLAQKEMTVEEWESAMSTLKTKKESLVKEVASLKKDVDGLKANLNAMPTYEDCVNEAYQLVGATKDDVDNFRNAVRELEGKIRRKEGPKEDRQKDLDALKRNKISALPEFFYKVHEDLQRMLDEWVIEVTDITYTVVKGDHLWGIARKKEHYGNGFAWPKIYNANRDKIKNPDLIYPKQEFKIPPLTTEEKDKYDRLKRNYKPAPIN